MTYACPGERVCHFLVRVTNSLGISCISFSTRAYKKVMAVFGEGVSSKILSEPGEGNM